MWEALWHSAFSPLDYNTWSNHMLSIRQKVTRNLSILIRVYVKRPASTHKNKTYFRNAPQFTNTFLNTVIETFEALTTSMLKDFHHRSQFNCSRCDLIKYLTLFFSHLFRFQWMRRDKNWYLYCSLEWKPSWINCVKSLTLDKHSNLFCCSMFCFFFFFWSLQTFVYFWLHWQQQQQRRRRGIAAQLIPPLPITSIQELVTIANGILLQPTIPKANPFSPIFVVAATVAVISDSWILEKLRYYRIKR